MTRRAYLLMLEVGQRWPSLAENVELSQLAEHVIVDNPAATAETLARVVRDQLSADATWQRAPL